MSFFIMFFYTVLRKFYGVLVLQYYRFNGMVVGYIVGLFILLGSSALTSGPTFYPKKSVEKTVPFCVGDFVLAIRR